MQIKFNILSMFLWIVALVGVYTSNSLMVSNSVLTLSVFLHLLINLAVISTLRRGQDE